MKFQNKIEHEMRDFSLLELLRNKENTLREGTDTIVNTQIKTHDSHEINPISNSKAEPLSQPSS